ncbi:MAG: DUF308 domain-containing protein [Propionibacteriaceae bacterium]|jgi:uncharacterized membrane protein HdeD (DUF308 family)|nr:DUF308 domain-containing protein [Propionibacteriaceae bacterium]
MAPRPFPFTLNAAELDPPAVTQVRFTIGGIGLVAAVIGTFITFWPRDSAGTLAIMLGIYWVLGGAGYFLVGFFSKGIDVWSRVLNILLAVVFVLVGTVVLFNPIASAETLALFVGVLLGVFWIFEGVTAIVQAGDQSSRWLAMILGGIAVVAGLAVLIIPLWSAAALFWLAGVGLIVVGVFQMVRALRFGRPGKPGAATGPTGSASV